MLLGALEYVFPRPYRPYGSCPCLSSWIQAHGAHLLSRFCGIDYSTAIAARTFFYIKTHANEHMLTKKNIREAKLKERDSTTFIWRENASLQIASHLKFFLFSAPIAGYWPIGSEVDPRPLMKELAAAGLDLCLPMTHKTDLSYHAFAFGDELHPAGFGTFAPKINTPKVRPLTLLVPLVAFDKTGARIGWGKGFYDRSIVDLKSDGQPLITIGIAYSFQQVDHVPVEPHDIGLDYVLTEKEVCSFKT